MTSTVRLSLSIVNNPSWDFPSFSYLYHSHSVQQDIPVFQGLIILYYARQNCLLKMWMINSEGFECSPVIIHILSSWFWEFSLVTGEILCVRLRTHFISGLFYILFIIWLTSQRCRSIYGNKKYDVLKQFRVILFNELLFIISSYNMFIMCVTS